MTKKVQTAVFAKTTSPSDVNQGRGWDETTATAWLTKHEFSAAALTITEAVLRFEQFDPKLAQADSFATLREELPAGVAFVVATPRASLGTEHTACGECSSCLTGRPWACETATGPVAAAAAHDALAQRFADAADDAAEPTLLETFAEAVDVRSTIGYRTALGEADALLGSTVGRLLKAEPLAEIEAAENALVRRAFTPEVKEINVAKRQVTHLISTSSIDRMNDVVDAGGWELDNYHKNPVVLADHNYSIFSIIGEGKARRTRDGLLSTTTYGMNPLGEAAWQLQQLKLMRAWSVGFRTLRAESVMDGAKRKCKTCQQVLQKTLERLGLADAQDTWIRGIHFLKQELLEYSAVAVPANQDAVAMLALKGLAPSSVMPLIALATTADVDRFVKLYLEGSKQGGQPTSPAIPAASVRTTESRFRQERISGAVSDALARMRRANTLARFDRAADEVTKR